MKLNGMFPYVRQMYTGTLVLYTCSSIAPALFQFKIDTTLFHAFFFLALKGFGFNNE